MEAYLFKLEILNHAGKGKHFNIVADSLYEAWKIFFEIALPINVYSHMYGWNATFLGVGVLIDNREEGK